MGIETQRLEVVDNIKVVLWELDADEGGICSVETFSPVTRCLIMTAFIIEVCGN
jgi:hypothetical protein